jgi:hypothetical protein
LQNVTLQRKNPAELNIAANNPKMVDVDAYFKLPTTPSIVAVEFKHAQDVPTNQLLDREEVNKQVVTYFVYVFAELVPDPKNSTLFNVNLVNRIRNTLGGNTEIYYFSTKNSIVSLVKVL